MFNPRTLFSIVPRPFARVAPQERCLLGPFFSSIVFFSFFFCLGEATHTISDKEERKERKRRESVGEEPRNVTLGAQLVGLLARVT
jgi:hypothetical protein